METPHFAPDAQSTRQPRFLRALRTREHSGQAILEFALVSLAFIMLVFGTLDFGRVIYKYSQLQNAVREGARYGKMNPTATHAIESVVIDNASSLVVMPDNIDVSCTGECAPGCADITVKASANFEFFTAQLLGLSDQLPIVISSSATVTSE